MHETKSIEVDFLVKIKKDEDIRALLTCQNTSRNVFQIFFICITIQGKEKEEIDSNNNNEVKK